jgi:hypothetical protein
LSSESESVFLLVAAFSTDSSVSWLYKGKPSIKKQNKESCNETDNYAPSFIKKEFQAPTNPKLSGYYAPSLRVKTSAKATQLNNICS